jgi:hypothetical protein
MYTASPEKLITRWRMLIYCIHDMEGNNVQNNVLRPIRSTTYSEMHREILPITAKQSTYIQFHVA